MPAHGASLPLHAMESEMAEKPIVFRVGGNRPPLCVLEGARVSVHAPVRRARWPGTTAFHRSL